MRQFKAELAAKPLAVFPCECLPATKLALLATLVSAILIQS